MYERCYIFVMAYMSDLPVNQQNNQVLMLVSDVHDCKNDRD